jgi:hypothetical protein
MKGILVHATPYWNIESILEDGALYDSSKTEPHSGVDDEIYQDTLNNKIFFQLIFESIDITRDYQLNKGLSDRYILLFDSSMMEEYGHKRYVKNEEQENKLKRYSGKSREFYLDNNVQKTKVWFNIDWSHGGFHKATKNKTELSFNYNPKMELEDNIQEFYDAKLRYIQKTAPTNDLDEYEELLEDEEYEMSEEEKNYWIEKFKPEMPKTFTMKAQNEVVFQAKRISLKATKKSQHLLAIYSYESNKKRMEKLEKEYPEYTFLKTPEELQEFMEMYYA